MREYLFRGKRVDNGEWVEGMPCSDLKGGVDAIQSNLGGGIFDIYPGVGWAVYGNEGICYDG